MDDTKIKDIYTKFAPIFEKIGADVAIAGGAIRDTILGRAPKDYDLFVLSDKKDSFMNTFFKNETSSDKEIVQLSSKEQEPSHNYLLNNLVYKELPVQVIFQNELSIPALFRRFDWNICLFAYGKFPNGERIGHYWWSNENEVSPGNKLRLNNMSLPYSSLRRGFRFSEKYKLELEPETIRQICAKILDTERKIQNGQTPEIAKAAVASSLFSSI